MNFDSYKNFHIDLIKTLTEQIQSTPPFDGSENLSDAQTLFSNRLTALNNDLNSTLDDGQPIGQWLINNIVQNYHHLTPIVPRDLFWYFGGDCLHFLGDEEINFFQNLEEKYHESKASDETAQADYKSIRDKLLGLSLS